LPMARRYRNAGGRKMTGYSQAHAEAGRGARR
jgi:hypothetical protein